MDAFDIVKTEVFTDCDPDAATCGWPSTDKKAQEEECNLEIF